MAKEAEPLIRRREEGNGRANQRFHPREIMLRWRLRCGRQTMSQTMKPGRKIELAARPIVEAPQPVNRSVKRTRPRIVVLVDPSASRGIIPVPAVVLTKSRGALELFLCQTDDVAFKARFIFQRVPGQRVIFRSQSQEAAETQDGIR